MNTVNYKISLDVHKSGIQCTLDGFVAGDTLTRRVSAALYEGGRPYSLPSACTATLYCEKPDGTVSFSSCESLGGMISHVFTSQECAVCGEMLCEFRIISADGTSVLSSPRFRVMIDASLQDDGALESSNEYTALTEALGAIPEVFVLVYSSDETDSAENLAKLNQIAALGGKAGAFMKDTSGELLPAQVYFGRGTAVRVTAVNQKTRSYYEIATVTGQSVTNLRRHLCSDTLDEEDDNMPKSSAVVSYVTQRLGEYYDSGECDGAFQKKLTAGEGIAISSDGTISLSVTDADGEVY